MMNKKISQTNQSAAHLRLQNQVCFPLYSAANAVTRSYRALLKKLDLTYLQYIVMLVLWEQEELNIKQLGEWVKLDSGTLTPLLKRLEGKGLIVRTRDEKDERARLITLTTRGQQLQRQAIDIPGKVACLTGLSKDELQLLKSLCEKTIKGLG